MKTEKIPAFREKKAIDVLSKFLRLSGGKVDKYWLNKVMYYIERTSIVETGEPIFFDKLYSLKYGPIVSAIKDGIDSAEYPIENSWAEYIETSGKMVILKKEAAYADLNYYEEELIIEAYKKFRDWDFEHLQEYFHNLPEHKETVSRVEIDYETILRSEGKNEKVIRDVISEIRDLYSIEKTLDCTSGC